MTTPHPDAPGPWADEREAALPAARRRRRRREWGRGVGRAVCGACALIGVLPFLSALVVRSSWARAWAARETQRLLRQQGIVAEYSPSLRIWPLAIELDRVRVESSDGGPP